LVLAGWFGARRSVAGWALRRAMTAAGLERATFQVRSVGLGSIEVGDLSIGSEPWLIADRVEATYSLADLAAMRVGTISVRNARWTVRVRDGVIDWGYVPKKSGATGGALNLNMPIGRVDLVDSVVCVIVDGESSEFPIAGRVTPIAADEITCRLDLHALGRAVRLTARATSSAERLTVEVDSRVEQPTPPATDRSVLPESGVAADVPRTSPLPPPTPGALPAVSTPQARLNATLHRAVRDGSMQVDVNLVLDSLAEQVGGMDIALSRATLTGQAGMDGGGQVTGLTWLIILKNARAGEFEVHSAELNAVKLDGPRVRVEAAAAGEGWQLPGVQATVALDANPQITDTAGSTILTVDMHTSKPVTFRREESGLAGELGSVAGAATIRVRGSDVNVLEGNVTLKGGSLTSGELSLSDVQAGAVMRSPDAVDVTVFSVVLGDGGAVAAAPFTFDPRAPRLKTRISMTNLSLAEWLPLLTKEHATGDGRVEGEVDIAIDLTAGAVRIDELSGSLRADPQHGFIQVADAEAVGELLDSQDPRFATDPTMRPVRDKIVAALRDFRYSTLTVALAKEEDTTVATAYLSGFGRHGQDPQGLNLTLNLHVKNELMDLASRILDLSKNSAAAGEALNRFFGEAPTKEEIP
ncbi:MAG: YdbH domain-containing protein, partial [Pyrinomonadaceae bacterium]|nr:YdbH domain-containing protein [Phycisphaerales bacterium]